MAADNGQIESSARASLPTATVEIVACRGCKTNCRFALEGAGGLTAEVLQAAARAGFSLASVGAVNHRMPQSRIRIALAACPNGCSMPQIRDIGLIADRRPACVAPSCTGCGRCEEACREGGITVQHGRAALHMGRCVGCGMCIEACPANALSCDATRWRLLVGGRMGRHARFADEIGHVEREHAAATAAAILRRFAAAARPGERVGHVVERMGAESLREIVQP